MEKGYKNIKQTTIKYVAILMGVCYVLNPLFPQINKVLHAISHNIEAPGHIISHKSTSINDNNVHDYGEHVTVNTEHKHDVIDFIASIIKASDEEGQSEKSSLLLKIKMDKHITTYEYVQNKVYINPVNPIFDNTIFTLKEGSPKTLDRPPKNLLG